MRLLIALLLSLLMVSPAAAQKTKAELATEISTNFPDNTSGLITPSILRTTVTDFVNSWQQALRVNAQTGTTYTFVVGDYGYLVTFSNASPVAVALPQATGTFATWSVKACNKGAGAVTITPTVSTIGGAATLVLQQNQCRTIVSDGTNYQLADGSVQPVTCAASNWISAISAALVPACSQPAFTDISGTLAVNKGGTGIASGTSGGVPYFSGATTIASSAALTQFGVVLGGGAGGAPTATAAGTAAQMLIGQSAAAPTWNAISGDASVTTAGVWTNSKVNGVTYGSSPATNTVPVVTGANTVTYEAVPNAALANSTITLNAGAGVGLTAPGSMALGTTNTIGATTDVPQFAGMTLTGALKPLNDTTTGLVFTAANGTNQIVRIDTLNSRIGINKTAGAFDLDVNGTVNVGTTLTFGTLSSTSLGASTSTITGLTVNNSPNTTNDYFLYFSAADNAIRKCTVGACSSAAAAGVSSLNGLTGGLSIVAGTGAAVSAGGTSVTVGLSAARATLPTTQVFTSGTDQTYTTPANVLWIEVTLIGGGGGGGASAAGASDGGAGGNTCWKASGTACTTPLYQATGGGGGGANGGAEGTGGGTAGSATCNFSITGGNGMRSNNIANLQGGHGGVGLFGGNGWGPAIGPTAGTAGKANTGSGGGGAASGGSAGAGSGGAAGGTCKFIITSPAATYVYTVGAAGTAGTSATANGGAGGSGVIQVTEHYGS